MSPAQQQSKDILFEKVTSRFGLMSAWLHVRPRLEHSRDEKIRADAATFASNVQLGVSQLQTSLRNASFKFEAQKGILKKRKAEFGKPAKDPRPIVVAPAKNRIVQRAILDVCQSKDPSTRRRLGKLVEVINRSTSVGGLPNRGVPEAITLIRGAMGAGATWYVRSDLKNFFQAVSKEGVRKFLEESVRGPKFIDLFMSALKTELSNEEDVRDLIRLFPTGLIGVPQGSALSALCANIVLSDFDAEFNQRGITTIRYLDDFVMLGRGKKSTESAFKSAERLLAKSGFECHDPSIKGSSKAASGRVDEGFDFLSFRISPDRIVPTRAARSDFLDDVIAAIGYAKSEIAAGNSNGRRAEPKYIQALAALDRKVRGWGDAFRPTTDRLIFNQLDDKIGLEIEKFQSWFLQISKPFGVREKRRALGIALLHDTPAEVAEHST